MQTVSVAEHVVGAAHVVKLHPVDVPPQERKHVASAAQSTVQTDASSHVRSQVVLVQLMATSEEPVASTVQSASLHVRSMPDDPVASMVQSAIVVQSMSASEVPLASKTHVALFMHTRSSMERPAPK